MTTSRETRHTEAPPTDVFDDPVAYLAGLGIESELVAETVLPAVA
ncbi:MAG TPA: hypothetical protein VF115_00820 [Acidimicrobiia bacterium]